MKNLIVVLGSLIVAFAFNCFLVPFGILSSGISGIAILLGLFTPLISGLLNLVLNLPLIVLGYYKLGKTITINTWFVSFRSSAFLYVIPVVAVTDNIMLSTVFGGGIGGLGVGLILKYSGTSGGLDIIAIIVSRTSSFSIGLLLTGMNGIIVLLSGFVFNWEIALYTLLSIYITGKMIDTIFTDHVKLTMQNRHHKRRLNSQRATGIHLSGHYNYRGLRWLYARKERYFNDGRHTLRNAACEKNCAQV